MLPLRGLDFYSSMVPLRLAQKKGGLQTDQKSSTTQRMPIRGRSFLGFNQPLAALISVLILSRSEQVTAFWRPAGPSATRRRCQTGTPF